MKNSRKNKVNLKKNIDVPKSLTKKSPFEVVMEAIYKLPNERMQGVLIHRFGLDAGKPKTLEAIGKSLMVTRERVRQIENEALRKIDEGKRTAEIDLLIKRLNELISNYQGIVSELRILKEFSYDKNLSDTDRRALLLLLRMGKEFNLLNKPQEYERTWYHKEADIESIHELKKWLVSELKNINKVISKEKILAILNKSEKLHKIPDEILYAYIDIPKAVQKNIFDKWGLHNWPEIKPRGVRDKIYLAFKKKRKPMHFSEIAKEVNSLGVDKKKTCAPTVHNELIKDPRFVLIGRGVYALREWKYQPGTVADILKSVLKKHGGGPVKRDILVTETLTQRRVKPSTIILNLNNSTLFTKEGKDLYSLRKNSK